MMLITVMAVMIISCNSGSVNGNMTDNNPPAGDSLPPVETRSPENDFQPAFRGQTRAPGMKTSIAINHTVVTDKLKKPWGIVSLPDGRFLVTQKEGSMVIVSQNGETGKEITGIPAVNSRGQGGLLGLTLDPDFQSNRIVYWAFSEDQPDGTLTALAKGKLSADESKMENVQVIYRAAPAFKSTLHYGGRVIFDKDGYLYLSTGEHSDKASRPQAQDLKSGMGKVIRLTKEGKPAPGNPFENNSDARPEIYSYGHRNVQGLAFHPVTGDLWENEFGPRGGDELNRIEPGKNYGWPIISYGMEYSGDPIPGKIAQKEGLEQPVYYWDPVLSPSGMCFYTGDLIPEWKNDLFICGLNSTHIARIRIKDNRVTGEERILADQNQRFRDITQGNDGALYAVTDGGRMYRIAN